MSPLDVPLAIAMIVASLGTGTVAVAVYAIRGGRR